MSVARVCYVNSEWAHNCTWICDLEPCVYARQRSRPGHTSWTLFFGLPSTRRLVAVGVDQSAVPVFFFIHSHHSSPHPHSWQAACKLTEDRLWVQKPFTNTLDGLIAFYFACLSEVVTRFETSLLTSHDSGLHRLLFFYIWVVRTQVFMWDLKSLLHSGNSDTDLDSFSCKNILSPCIICETMAVWLIQYQYKRNKLHLKEFMFILSRILHSITF